MNLRTKLSELYVVKHEIENRFDQEDMQQFDLAGIVRQNGQHILSAYNVRLNSTEPILLDIRKLRLL